MTELNKIGHVQLSGRNRWKPQERKEERKMHEKNVSRSMKLLEDAKELSFRIRWKRIISEEKGKQEHTQTAEETSRNENGPR